MIEDILPLLPLGAAETEADVDAIAAVVAREQIAVVQVVPI
ncbi:MAG: hypothetical protein ACRD15_19700 [Vicinamibacterales bacterium]